jgi:putative transposase
MTEQFQHKYRIPSTRVSWHDYCGGTYFVTICTAERKYYLGEIVDDGCRDAVDGRDAARHVSTEPQMRLSEIGMCATENFNHVTEHYPYAEIPLFVVMPNHIHAVVIIDGAKIPYKRNNIEARHIHVETRRATSLQSEAMANIANMQGWLSVVIGGLKSTITRYAHDNEIPFIWQTRFYEHVVRSQDELNLIGEYIQLNVAKWSFDKLNMDKKQLSPSNIK